MAFIIPDDITKEPKPLKLLEASVSSCIYLGMKKTKFDFGKVTVYISNETIKIISYLEDEGLIEYFNDVVKNCYISNHCNFKKQIKYKNFPNISAFLE